MLPRRDQLINRRLNLLRNHHLKRCEILEGAVRVPVPASPVSTVLIVSDVKLSPPALLRLDSPVGAAGAANVITLRYRPLGVAKPGRAGVELTLPDGWSARPAEFDAKAPCDVPLRFVTAPGTKPGAFDAGATVTLPGSAPVRLPARLLLHDALEVNVEFAAQQVKVRVTSNCAETLPVTCAVTGPEWLRLEQPEQRASLQAGGTLDLAFEVTGPVAIGEGGRIVATVQAGGATATASADVRPPDVSAQNWSRMTYEGAASCRLLSLGTPNETLIIKTSSATDRAGWQWRTGVPAPGTKITFSGQVRTEGMRSDAGGARARIICFHRTKANRGTRPTIYTDFVKGTTDWQDFEVSFEVPPETATVQIELFNWYSAGESFWRALEFR